MTVAPTVSVGGGMALHHRRGDGPAVCWVHGYTMDSTVWRPLWDRLPGWDHLALDLPGHGASRPLDATDTLPSLGAELGRVAIDAGARHLVAMSFGTIVALQMALEHPDAFDTVTLSSPAFGGGPTDADVAARYEEMARHHAAHGADDELVALWMRHPPGIFAGISQHPAVAEGLRAVIGRHHWTELTDGHLFRIVRYPQAAVDLGSITATVHILVGEHDLPSTRRSADILAGRLRHARQHTVDGTGHLSLLEDPGTGALLVQRHVEAVAP